MTVIVKQSVLTRLSVRDAMRRQFVRLPQSASLDHSINYLIKFKTNALLVTNTDGQPVGVVSKTDIMGAHFAGLPLESPLTDIMVSPPLFCQTNDPLEETLDVMQKQRVYRLYVRDSDGEDVVGALAYPDVVGLLYRYCHTCERSLVRRNRATPKQKAGLRLRVKDVMTENVVALQAHDTLMQVMESLSINHFSAVLIEGVEKRSAGVISKTDLILAYKHQVPAEISARHIMTSPVRACDEKDYLEDAIQVMIFAEVQRIFVQRNTPHRIVGVLSLSDAARIRSGSCQACVISRIRVEGPS